MEFQTTKIPGVQLIRLDQRGDERGWLTRTWCQREFKDNSIDLDLKQGYVSFTKESGTIRGFHYQVESYAMGQLTRCLQGLIFEVVIDLRSESPAYGQWQGWEIKAEDHTLLYVPKGCAHGFLTLTDDVLFLNLYSQTYQSEYEKGIRYDDPAFKIKWPIKVKNMSEKDKSWENFMDSRLKEGSGLRL